MTSSARPLTFPAHPDLSDPGLRPALQRMGFAVARAAFDSDAQMALAFGVDRSNMARWRAGAAMSLENVERLQAFETAVTLLLSFLAPTTIPKWLRGTNAHLMNRRPIDVLLNGRLSEVVSAIENERSGAFA